jgi:hypothetical protein
VTESTAPYPVRVDSRLDPALSRGLWLVKWLLLIPHYVVLAFLWLAFVLLTVVAFFAILITGRYPRPLFDFDVGVLRWTWRVHYYGYGALGTDRYPPFTLADVPDYPAHLDVPYPERLSRGLVLVKWWLLALPHYLVLAVFVGGGIWLGTRDGNGVWDDGWGAGGLVGLLVLIAAVVLLFTGRYPRPLYDFVLGMDRWALRVAAYAALMTDRYPPFRMDMGGTDPGSVHVGPSLPPPPAGTVGAIPSSPDPSPAPGTPLPPAAHHSEWTGGRVVAVVLGALLLFISSGLLVSGGTLAWADQTQRDGDYLWTSRTEIDSPRYAITSEGIELDVRGADWVIDDFLGAARLEVTPAAPDTDLFVGVARSQDVAGYLGGVGHHRVGELGPGWDGDRMGPGMMTDVQGGRPATPPGDLDIWAASSSGPGTRVLDWRPESGTWTVVVMRADGGAGIDAEARVGATAPGLPWLYGGLLVAGAVLGLIGTLLVILAVRRAQQAPGGAIPSPRAPLQGGPTTPAAGPPAVGVERRP